MAMPMKALRVLAIVALCVVPAIVSSGCAAGDGMRGLWTMRSDESIIRGIKHKFKDAGPEFLALEVRVLKQKVTIKGELTKEQKSEAERLVWGVTGVDSVFMDVKVK